MRLIGTMAQQGQQSQKGFSLIEIMAVLAIAALLVVGVLFSKNLVDDSLAVNQFTSDVGTMATQSRSWRGMNPNYAPIGDSITIAKLTAMNLLPNAWGTGTGVSPTGGDYTVLPDATDDTLVSIKATAMTQPTCLAVARKISSSTNSAPTCASGTLTATFR